MTNNYLGKILFIISLFMLLSCSSSDDQQQSERLFGSVFLAHEKSPVPNVLYHANYDGSELRQISHVLTNSAETIKEFIVSPDRKYVAYTINNVATSISDLYIADLNQETTRKVGDNVSANIDSLGVVTGFAWSPDSMSLAYKASNLDGMTERLLYKVNTRDYSRENLLPNTYVSSFKWSPDGRYLAYYGSKINISDSLGIYIVSSNGNNDVKVSGDLLAGEDVYADGMLWSPTGEHLAYTKKNLSGLQDIYSVRPDGTDNYLISDGSDSFLYPGFWDWAPDGTRMAYLSDIVTPGYAELYTVLANGTDVRKVSKVLGNGEFVDDFKWSPDGLSIAYTAGIVDDKELYTVAPIGGNHKQITDYTISNDYVSSFYLWSPDSKNILYALRLNSRQLFIAEHDTASSNSIVVEESIDDLAIQNPVWSPDSTKVAFLIRVGSLRKLYTASFDGKNVQQVSPQVLYDGVYSVDFNGFSWLSDSSHLIYMASYYFQITDLFSVSYDGINSYSIAGDIAQDGDVVSFSAD